MKLFALLAFCLLALSALSACTGVYDGTVYPEKLYDPGTQ